MKLSKTQRDKLKAKGFSAKDIADVEAELVEEEAPADDEPGRRTKPKEPRRVFMLEGDDADSFIERLFGGSSDETPEDEGDDETEPEPEEPTEPEADEKPTSSVGYFRDRAKRGA